MILLIVDTQNEIVCDKLYQFEIFKKDLIKLISLAREHSTEVVFIRHDDRDDRTTFDPGLEIYAGFAPTPNERIFEKSINSPFRDSGLLEYLIEKNERKIMVAGLMTEYCIDATIKCGFEHGLEIFVPASCNSTFDNSYMSAEQTHSYYNNFIWNNRYAKTISIEEATDLLVLAARKTS